MIGEVSALARREARRDLVDKGRLLFDAAWPLMILIVLGFGVDAFAPPKADLSYGAFLGAGVIGLLLLRQCASFGKALEHEARFGYREYLVTPVKKHWIILGSFFGRWVVQSTLALIVLAVYAGAMRVVDPMVLAQAVLAVLLSVAAALGAGLLLAVFVVDLRKHVLKLWIAAIILALISGVFFPINYLPFGLGYLAYISPLTYMVDSVRGSLVGVSVTAPAVGMALSALIALLCIGIGIIRSDRLFRF